MISKSEYIQDLLSKQPDHVQKIAAAYVKTAIDAGARLCNDGFPDTRFKCTYPQHFLKIRMWIDRCRKLYDYDYPYTARNKGSK